METMISWQQDALRPILNIEKLHDATDRPQRDDLVT